MKNSTVQKRNNNRTKILCDKVERVTSLGGLTSGRGTVIIDPALTRITATLGTVYRYWRFTEFSIEVLPGVSAALTFQYVPGGATAVLGTLDFVMEGSHAQMITPSNTNGRIIRLNKADLVQNQPWFITERDATDAFNDIIGSIQFEGATAETFAYRLCITYEFKEPLDNELIALVASARVGDKFIKDAKSMMSPEV